MKEKTLEIINETGLHARPASLFVQAAQKFDSKIEVKKGDSTANAKSIMSIMALGAGKGATVTITAEGNDEEEAVAKLAELIESGFGEE